MKTHFADLFRYNHKSNVAIISTCLGTTVPVEGKAIRLFSHVLNAHQIWLNRIENEVGEPDPWRVHDLDHWLGVHEANHFRTLQTLENDDLARSVEYVNTKGHRFQNEVQDILFHIINHSTYHRGQVASFLASSGVQVPVTDFIAYKRG